MPAINPKNKQTRRARNRKEIAQNLKRRSVNKPKVSRVRNLHKALKKFLEQKSADMSKFLPMILQYEKVGAKMSGTGVAGRKERKIISRNLSKLWSRFRSIMSSASVDSDAKTASKVSE